jgi:hypothetical protein
VPNKGKPCFRCLSVHMTGERYCPLAAEYEPPPELEREVLW